MLVRLDNNELVEYPDEVGALLLADPSEGDVPDFSLEELNCLISGGFAALYDEELTLEKNIEHAIEHYTRWGKPTESNLEKARQQIKYYKENIAPDQVVSMDVEVGNETENIQRKKPKAEVYIIENMPNPPKKLIGHSDISEQTAQKFDENS
jgi:hypothetical protein